MPLNLLQRVKILVVEDSIDQLSNVKEYLEEKGYNIVQATDGVSVLNLINQERPDLILLDLLIPGKDGFEVCSQIKKTYPELPVFIVTIQKEIKTKLKGFESGCDDYLTKPYEPQELVARIKVLLEGSLK